MKAGLISSPPQKKTPQDSGLGRKNQSTSRDTIQTPPSPQEVFAWMYRVLTQPMTKLTKLSGITCLVGKNSRLNGFFFSGSINWLSEGVLLVY